MMARILFALVLVFLISVTAYVFLGAEFAGQAENQILTSVSLKKTYVNGRYDISGIVSMPTDCHDLSVDTEEVSSKEFELVFKSAEDKSRVCVDEVSARAIHASVIAPRDTVFTASMNGIEIELELYE